MDRIISYYKDYCSTCADYTHLKRILRNINSTDITVRYGEDLNAYRDKRFPIRDRTWISYIGDHRNHNLHHNGYTRFFGLFGTCKYKLCKHEKFNEYIIHVNPLYECELKECIGDYKDLIKKIE